MRQGSSTLYYLLTDHLGSTAITATSGGGWYGELRYYPWGGTRYDTGTTPTSFRYTGQRQAEVGLYYYGARYYDPQVGRFVSPDSIIPNPGDPVSFDRFAYVRNNPIKFYDPTGHWSCGDQYDPACAENPIEMAQYQIMVAGHQPTLSCIRNADCADAYDTFVAVTASLGYVPSMSEILYMTAGTEYYSYIGYKIGVRATGQEGLARNYYEACDRNGCSGSELYAFLSGFQPWFGKPSVREKESASTRAAYLIDMGLGNEFYETGDELWNDVNQILNQVYADRQGWTNGAEADEPWQWYGPFSLGINRKPSFGPESNKDAILSVDMVDGTVFWMFTFSQDEKFDIDYWSSPDEEQGN
jgi:RHS repeat-associated protein